MRLSVEGLSFAYGRKRVLNGLELDGIESGQLTALLGPNAVGKSTFFRCLAGLRRPMGRVVIADGDAGDSRVAQPADLRKLVIYLPQDQARSAVLTVFEAVLLARQRGVAWVVADADLQRVGLALAELGIEGLALRHLDELSGGQRQLVSVAQVLVRDAPILLLDEPTSNLDLQRQLEVLRLVRRLAVECGRTVVVALHDLNLAARFADRVVVLHQGAIHATGTPAAVLTADLLQNVYGVVARVWLGEDGVPHVIPLHSARDSALSID
jgi:iron complex transport system ATP-binding protein